MFVMSAAVSHLRRQVGKRASGQRDLAVGGHTFGNFDATDVEPERFIPALTIR
jgi:hypothetical protein